MNKLILLLLVLPASLFAEMPEQSGIPDMGQMFMTRMDANKDGKVTFAEFRKPGDEQFANMDTNKDGVVNVEEARAYVTLMMKRLHK